MDFLGISPPDVWLTFVQDFLPLEEFEKVMICIADTIFVIST